MIKVIEVLFPVPLRLSSAWWGSFNSILGFLPARLGPTVAANDGSVSVLVAHLDRPLEHFPEGWDRLLMDLVDMACKTYEHANPTRVMWPAGVGSRPNWSAADAAFLGHAPTPGAPESGEPTFDDSVFQISCSEREDYHGSNRHNPDGEQLRKAAHERHRTQAKHERRQRVVSYLMGCDDIPALLKEAEGARPVETQQQ